MKKILLFICMILGVCGCSCNKDELIKIKKEETPTVEESSSYLYSKHGLLTYQLDDTSEYDAKIENKDSFVLFIYRETCYGCDTLSPGIKNYLEENDGATIYSLELEEIGANHNLKKEHNISGTPWIIIIEEGSVSVKYLMPAFSGKNDEENQKSAKDWFYDLMEKHVSWEE